MDKISVIESIMVKRYNRRKVGRIWGFCWAKGIKQTGENGNPPGLKPDRQKTSFGKHGNKLQVCQNNNSTIFEPILILFDILNFALPKFDCALICKRSGARTTVRQISTNDFQKPGLIENNMPHQSYSFEGSPEKRRNVRNKF